MQRQYKAARKGTKYIQNLGFSLTFLSSLLHPVNAANTFVTLLSLHLLNNSQQWGYHYSNLKVMTELRGEGGKKLFLEESIKTAPIWACQQVGPEVSQGSMLQASEAVDGSLLNKYLQIALLFQGCDSQCSKQNPWKARCRANLSRNCWQLCVLGKKMTDPKNALKRVSSSSCCCRSTCSPKHYNNLGFGFCPFCCILKSKIYM